MLLLPRSGRQRTLPAGAELLDNSLVGTSPERWRSVEELYQAALDLPSGQRAAWLKEACADEELQREVESQVSKARFTARFEREARAIAAFNHPNIRTIHDVGPNYLVMELIDGVPVTSR